jgi:ribonuclease HI
MRATVITDASFDHQHPAKPAGWAAWVRVDGRSLAVKGYGSVRAPCESSTVAEIYAALNGIWLATGRGATDVLVRSDCLAVQDCILGNIKSQRIAGIWRDAMATPWGRSLRDVRSRHVKGHANPNRHAAGYCNDWCDKQAKLAMRMLRKGKHTRVII